MTGGWRRVFGLVVLVGLVAIHAPSRAADPRDVAVLIGAATAGQPAKCGRCDLSDIDLSLINLANSRLSGADFTRSNLSGANLTGASLAGAILFKANLIGTNLTDANLGGADIRRAQIAGARLCRTTMPDWSIASTGC